MRLGVRGEEARRGVDVVVEEDDDGLLGGGVRAAVAGRGKAALFLLDQPKPVGQLERASHLGAAVGRSVEDRDDVNALRRVVLAGERFEHAPQRVAALVGGDGDGEPGRLALDAHRAADRRRQRLGYARLDRGDPAAAAPGTDHPQRPGDRAGDLRAGDPERHPVGGAPQVALDVARVVAQPPAPERQGARDRPPRRAGARCRRIRRPRSHSSPGAARAARGGGGARRCGPGRARSGSRRRARDRRRTCRRPSGRAFPGRGPRRSRRCGRRPSGGRSCSRRRRRWRRRGGEASGAGSRTRRSGWRSKPPWRSNHSCAGVSSSSGPM